MRIVEVTTSPKAVTGVNLLVVCNSTDPIALSLSRHALGYGCGYYIKNIGSGTVTVTPVLNDFIDGAATRDLLTHECIYIMDYSANNWIVISNNYVP